LLSDGPNGIGSALYGLYEALPTGGLFRTPERLRLLTLFGVIALAVFGLDAALGDDAAAPTTRTRIRVWLASGSVALVIAGAGADGAAWRAFAAWALLGVGLVGGLATRPALRSLAGIAAFGLLLLDLALATGPYGSLRSFPGSWSRVFHTRNHAVVDAGGLTTLLEVAGDGRIELIGAPGAGLRVRPPLGVGVLAGVDRLSCYEPLVPRAWSLLARETGAENFVLENLDVDRYASIYSAASVTALVRLRPADPDAPIAQALAAAKRSLGFYATGADPKRGLPEGVIAERSHRPGALPRAYRIGRFEVADDATARSRLIAGDFDPHAVVLLDRDPGLASGSATATPVTITRHDPERVEISLEPGPAGLLVLTDSHYPGWQVLIDGEAGEILRANALFRAVALPADARRVEFRYAPTSFRLGVAISVVSAFTALVGAWMARRRRPS
jgi:hypothetical protein